MRVPYHRHPYIRFVLVPLLVDTNKLTTITQFNAAALLHTSSSIALVPFTANLLFSIGYALYSVGEYIIHIAASFIYLMLLFLSLGIRTAYIAVLHALAPLLYIFRPMSPFLSSALHPIFRFVFAGSPTRSAALSEIMKSTSLFIGSSFTLLKDSSATSECSITIFFCKSNYTQQFNKSISASSRRATFLLRPPSCAEAVF